MVLWFFALIYAVVSLAGTPADPYYGHEFLDHLQRHELKGPALRDSLHRILEGSHNPGADGFDSISNDCQSPRCYHHDALGYVEARKVVMGQLFLVDRPGGRWGLRDLYCDRVAEPEEFGNLGPGPGKVPDSRVMNLEHTWPQSHFSSRYPEELQKSDMHHLFPTDAEANSRRSSYPFGVVARDSVKMKCSASRLGNSSDGKLVFQPPVGHRGHVARALFYFSVRYEMPIDPAQEAVLREWHRAEPVDAGERDRHEKIFALQKDRNPFVDFPDLVDQIGDF